MYTDLEDDEPRKSHGWVVILNSPVTVALITVIVGGIFTTCISNSLQQSAKNRELAATWLHELAQHRLAAQKSYLDEQWTAVDDACKLVGRIRSASLGLLDTTSAEFADDNFRTARRQHTNEEQREKLRSEFNSADDAWQAGYGAFAYRLADYPIQSMEVVNAWNETRDAVERLKACAESQYREWVITGKPVNDRCRAEDATVTSALARLSAGVRLSRSRARWDWENASTLSRMDGLH